MADNKEHDVIIIGAGAAGVGLGALFEKMGFKNYVILEQDTVGSSFKQWCNYTEFITPSFTGNAFNAVDLNAVTPDTSPAHTLKTEHPTGEQYAEYLELVADHFNLNVKENTKVTKLEKQTDLFLVHTRDEVLQTQFVVWAGGEFQYPALNAMPGAEHCIHSSRVREALIEEQTTIIGGYESGMELALQQLRHGKAVTVIDREAPWEVNVSDASISLSTYTRDRLRPYVDSKLLTLIPHTEVTEITREETGYTIHTKQSGPIPVPNQPVLATGFSKLPALVADRFAYTADGQVAITEADESTITPNLFLTGPKVRHGGAIFCFIYKFRQRLPIVAETITERLGLDLYVPDEYYRTGMYLKDLSCCADECAC